MMATTTIRVTIELTSSSTPSGRDGARSSSTTGIGDGTFPGVVFAIRPGPSGPATLAAVPEPKPIESWMSDMDGVLVHEGKLIPGADTFVERLQATGTPFLVLTNNSIFTPRDLRYRLLNTGLDIPVESIWTSAMATATFLDSQRPEGSAFVIGEAGSPP